GSMAVEIKVPAVGESVTEGTISRWLKREGATVRANEPVCELETDKATQEIMAPAAGVLAITAPEGKRVAVGAVIGRIDPAGAGAPARAPEPARAAPAAQAAPLGSNDRPPAPRPAAAATATAPPAESPSLSPAAR